MLEIRVRSVNEYPTPTVLQAAGSRLRSSRRRWREQPRALFISPSEASTAGPELLGMLSRAFKAAMTTWIGWATQSQGPFLSQLLTSVDCERTGHGVGPEGRAPDTCDSPVRRERLVQQRDISECPGAAGGGGCEPRAQGFIAAASCGCSRSPGVHGPAFSCLHSMGCARVQPGLPGACGGARVSLEDCFTSEG